uniref:uncharacterized protein akna n=1 Tax=Centroberyx gerrardi TaxID=166262 RepID=UPI003AAF70CC
METRQKSTTAGVLFWTPAPVRISPTSSVASEDGWEDANEEMKAEKEEDFHSQMDENGIIGLKEALEDVELGGNDGDGDVDEECNPPWSAGANGHDGFSLAQELDMPPDELSYNLSELQDSESLSHSEPLEEDKHILTLYDDMAGSLEVWTEDEEVRQREEEEEQRWPAHRHSADHLPERDEQLDMTEEEKDGEEEGKRSDSKRKRDEHTSISGSSATGLGTMHGLVESHIAKGNNRKISSTARYSADLLTLEVAGPSKRSSENRTPDSVVCGSGNISPSSPSNLLHPVSQSPSPPRAPTFPHLLYFSSEEIADVPGIEAETFPEMGFTESLPESYSSRLTHHPKPHWPHESEREELNSRTSPKPAAISPEQGMSNHQNGVSNGPTGGSGKSNSNHRKRPTPSPRKMRQHSPEATYSRTRSLSKVWAGSSKSTYQNTSPERTPRESHCKTQARTIDAEVDEARRGPLSYPTPDFSKVEPRVRFPKSGYKPPKSRGSSKTKSPSAEPPLVFKSPADIVREVLLSSTDGPSPSSDSNTPTTCVPNSTVPEDFRCPQQATTLIEQLQEDYNRLLTKYAEAENTIDRLRLEAKVNLYSDPPKPSHSVQSGVIHEGSKFMTLNFPQAQRAEISSSSVYPNGPGTSQSTFRDSPARPSSATSISSRRSLGPQVGQQLTRTLSKQADKFLQQVQTFEDLLKSGKLKPFEQMKGLSQLVQGLDSLERGYLLARDEHRLAAEIGPFDPNRELEGLIFQCGMRVEELKEQVEQMGQDQPTQEAPPSPPPHPTPLSVPAEGGEPMPHPESPLLPVAVESGGVVGVEVSSASGESDGDEAEMEDEEALPSLFLRPLHCKHRLVEQDFCMLMDHYQSFKELPNLLDHGLREGVPLFPGTGNGMQHGEEGKEGLYQGTGNVEVQNSLPQRQAKSGHQDSPPVSTGKQRTNKSDPPSPRGPSRSPALPSRLPSGSRRLEVGKSHSSSLTSLGESAASERRGSKLQPGSRRVLSQDGIISPETDSGFVGSESSRLTLAAVSSPIHQRASASVSLPQEGNPGKPQAGPGSGPPLPASSPSDRRTSLEHSDGSQLSNPRQIQGQTRRSRRGERRRTSTSSSQERWARQTPQTRADSGTSEFGLDSDHTHTVSEEEEGQSDQYAESTNSQHSYRPSPSPAAPYHHGDPLRALSSGQVTNRNEAIQNLQAEVTRLKERLESSLRKSRPLSSVRAAPSAQGNHTHRNTSTPRIRSGQRRRDGSRGERRERRIVDELEEECAPRPAPRKRSASGPRQRPELDITTDSEHDHSTHQPRLSRRIPTSPAAPDNCRSSDTVRSRRAPTRQHPGLSERVSEAADEPDSRGSRAPVCPQCSSRHHGHSERPVGGDSEPVHTSSHSRHCPLCGRPELCRSTNTEPARRRERESDPAHRSCQPTASLDRGGRGGYLAAPAPPVLGSMPLVQCVPVCPPPVLLYSSPVTKMDSYPQPFCVSLGSGVGASSGVRGRGEVRGHTGRSVSADEQRCLDSSLNSAIKAARDMKHTSGRMARSLATGLHYQESLSQSCIY